SCAPPPSRARGAPAPPRGAERERMVPGRTRRLDRPLELEACGSDDGPKPVVDGAAARLAREQNAFGGERTDRNGIRAGVAMRGGHGRQQRLVPERVDANAEAARRRRSFDD